MLTIKFFSTRSLSYLFLASLCIIFLSCDKSDNSVDPPDPSTSSSYKYFTAYVSDPTNATALFKAFEELPTGDLSASDFKDGVQSQSGDWSLMNTYDNWMFARADETKQMGVIRYDTDFSTGKITNGGYIVTGGETSITVVNETLGYYNDPDRGKLKIQKFNPSTMTRTGEIDLSSLSVTNNGANAPTLTSEEKSTITEERVGGYLIAVKDGKIYLDVRYQTLTGGDRIGSLIDKVFVAVLDAETEEFEKLITYEGARQIGKSGKYHKKWIFNKNYLYMITYGDTRVRRTLDVFRQPKIIRINTNTQEFDDFEINSEDYYTGEGKMWFNGLAIYKGGLYTYIGTRPFAWDFSDWNEPLMRLNRIDLITKKETVIKGLPLQKYFFNNTPFVKNDKLWILAGGCEEGKSGLYWYDGSSLEKKFGVEGKSNLKYLFPLGK